jgi:putative ABC transport system permease protein
MAACAEASMNLTGSGEPERVNGMKVTANTFAVLGVQPALGRALFPEEEQPGHAAVAVLSDGLWKRRFSSGAGVVSSSITLDGAAYSVIGVMPAGFQFPHPGIDVWIPLALTAKETDASQRGQEYLSLVARLKPDVTLEMAQTDMDRITREVLDELPESARDYFGSAGWGASVISLQRQVVGEVRTALLVL